MTIAAGFHCKDGVLVCADTEHSAYGLSYHDSKIFKVETSQLKALFSFTGNVHLAHSVIQKCAKKLESAKPGTVRSHDDIAQIVEQTVHSEYRKHVCAEPNPEAEPTYRLLVAAWCNAAEGAAVYATWHGAIERVPRYECMGAGLYIGHQMLGPIFSEAMDLERAGVLSICTVAAAKEHVDGVGGKTNMVSILHDGIIVKNDWIDIQPVESVLKSYDINARYLLFDLLSKDDAFFNSKLEFIGKMFLQMRRILRIDDQSQAETQARNQRLIAGLTALAERSAQQSTTRDPQPPPASQE